MFCTQRAHIIANTTFKQLGELLDCVGNVCVKTKGILDRGILFCGEESKADCINSVVSQIDMKFVVVDDMVHNLTALDRSVDVLEYFHKRPFDQIERPILPKKIVVAVSGKMGSGKDLFGKLMMAIFDDKKVHVLKFADRLKHLCAKVTDTEIDANYNKKDSKPSKFADIDGISFCVRSTVQESLGYADSYKEQISVLAKKYKDVEGTVSLAQMQVIIGNTMRDQIDKNVWVYCVKKQIESIESGVIVITDMRFKNELEEFSNIPVFRLERDRQLRLKSICGRNENDISETDLDSVEHPFTIVNNYKTKHEFMAKIASFF